MTIKFVINTQGQLLKGSLDGVLQNHVLSHSSILPTAMISKRCMLLTVTRTDLHPRLENYLST